MKETKEIIQGTIFGYELVIKVPKDFPDDDLIVNKNTLEKYIKQITKPLRTEEDSLKLHYQL